MSPSAAGDLVVATFPRCVRLAGVPVSRRTRTGRQEPTSRSTNNGPGPRRPGPSWASDAFASSLRWINRLRHAGSGGFVRE